MNRVPRLDPLDTVDHSENVGYYEDALWALVDCCIECIIILFHQKNLRQVNRVSNIEYHCNFVFWDC